MSGALDKDPAFLTGFIGKNVSAKTESGKVKTGRCLSIDPVSGSLVLVAGKKLLLLPWIDVVS